MASKAALEIIMGAGSWGGGTTAGAATLGDKAVIQTLLDEYKRRGYNHIDTARVYGSGKSEEVLAELDYVGQGFILDTKINSFFPGAHKAENIEKSLQQSLTALKQNKVNVLYLHTPDRTVQLEETLAAINAEYKKGHFAKFGISNYSAAEVEEILKIANEKGYVKPSVYQGAYNLVGRAGEKELFPLLRKHGISFYAYSPLGGSFLTDAMNKDHQAPEASRFDPNTPIGKISRGRYFKDALFQVLEKLQEVAKQHNTTVPEIALRWIAHHSQLKREYNDAVIIGGTKLQNIKHSLDSLEGPPLPADILQVVEDLWRSVPEGEAPSYYNK